VLRARVDEEVGAVHGGGELSCELDVVVAIEDVQLQPHAVGPRRRPVVAPSAERERGVAEDRAVRAGPCLCERLGRQHPERETDVDDLARQRPHGVTGAPDHGRRAAELLRVRHPFLDRLERPTVEEVGRVHGVTGLAQVVGKPANGVCEPERVVKKGRPHPRAGNNTRRF
jgi:hypothetical protein